MVSQTIDFSFDFLLLGHDDAADFSRHGSPQWSYRHDEDVKQLRLLQSSETGEIAPAGTLYYVDIHRAPINQMERMFKTLQGIERKLDKIQEKQGYPVDLADYAARVAQVLKIDVLVLLHSAHDRARTGYRWESIDMDGRAIDRLRRVIAGELMPIDVASTELATA
jgi:hypothetical protein